MAKLRYQDYLLETCEDVTDDVICCICKWILEAPTIGKCGCRYCRYCIDKWFKSGNNYCPGKVNNCGKMDLELDVSNDYHAHKKIQNFIYKCPHENCTFQSQKSLMINHIRSCPCLDQKSESKSNHCLMPDSPDFVIRKGKQLPMKNYWNNIENQLQSLNNHLTKNVQMTSSVVKYSPLSIRKIKTNTDSETTNISISSNKENMLVPSHLITNDPTEYWWMVHNLPKKQLDATVDKSVLIQSDCFYSHFNEYKLRLQLHIVGDGTTTGTNLMVAFTIFKGEFDEILLWPMKKLIRISLLDHKTRNDIVAVDFNSTASYGMKKCYDRPLTDSNEAVEMAHLISFEQLFNDPGVLSNGSILVRCAMFNSM